MAQYDVILSQIQLEWDGSHFILYDRDLKRTRAHTETHAYTRILPQIFPGEDHHSPTFANEEAEKPPTITDKKTRKPNGQISERFIIQSEAGKTLVSARNRWRPGRPRLSALRNVPSLSAADDPRRAV